MAVQTDDEPKDGRKSALIAIILGLALGVFSSAGAFLFTYEGVGPGPDDPMKRGAVTALIFFGMLFAIVLLIVGAATYWYERGSGK
jgi:hypothetical protein